MADIYVQTIVRFGKDIYGRKRDRPFVKGLHALWTIGQGSLWQQLTSNFLLANFVVNDVNI